MPDPIVASTKEIMEAVTALRDTFDEKNLDNSEVKTKVDKINKFLDVQEEINQKAVLAETQYKKENEELKRLLKLVIFDKLHVLGLLAKKHLKFLFVMQS